MRKGRPRQIVTDGKKICTKCKRLLFLQDFYFRKTENRYSSWCDSCRNQRAKDFRSENRDKIRDLNLRRNVGISWEEKSACLEKQSGCCAICKTTDPGMGGNWCADHNHKTGKFRGVLCGRCNSVLGYALDSPAILLQAVNYLHRTKEPVF